MLTRAQLVNISIFMRMAAESGAIKSVNDIMAFAETAQVVTAMIAAMDEAAKSTADAS